MDGTGLVVAVIVILLVLVLLAYIYNGLIRARNRVENAWGQVDVQLRRRYDLIPNLVETVKGYASHEKSTFEAVVEARAASQSATTVEAQAQAENMLTGALRQLFALAEAYPELKAATNFQSLQQELSETEGKIAIARQIYNDATLTYNNAVQTVPTNIVASLLGFRTKPYFEAAGDERSVPQVDF